MRLAVLVAAALAASTASAQDTDALMMMGRSSTAPEIPEDSEALRATYALADCLAGQNPNALQVLASIPYSENEFRNAFWGSFEGTTCRRTHESAPVSVRLLRGVIAERLLHSGNNSAATGRAARQQPFAMPGGPDLAGLDGRTRSAITLIQFGECVARADSAGLDLFLATNPTTPEERTAFAALQPALAGCIPQGASIRMSARQMRGYMAEGAYRNFVMASQGAGATQ